METIDEIQARQRFQNYMRNPLVVNGTIKGFYMESEIFQAMQDVMNHYGQAGLNVEGLRIYLGRNAADNNNLTMMVVGVENQAELTDHIVSITPQRGLPGPCPPNCDQNSPILR